MQTQCLQHSVLNGPAQSSDGERGWLCRYMRCTRQQRRCASHIHATNGAGKRVYLALTARKRQLTEPINSSVRKKLCIVVTTAGNVWVNAATRIYGQAFCWYPAPGRDSARAGVGRARKFACPAGLTPLFARAQVLPVGDPRTFVAGASATWPASGVCVWRLRVAAWQRQGSCRLIEHEAAQGHRGSSVCPHACPGHTAPGSLPLSMGAWLVAVI